MKVSTRFRYGLRAVLTIAEEQDGGPVPTTRIAEVEAVSVKYLEHIMARLVKARLVVAQRGAQGGYLLASSPVDISLYDVMEAVGDGPALTPCVEDPGSCERSGTCSAWRTWRLVDRQMRRMWQGISLADVRDQELPDDL